MKTYICDSCERVISDPFEMKMKEFYVRCSFEVNGVLYCNSKRKVKIHLCGDCYKGLHLIAEKVSNNDIK